VALGLAVDLASKYLAWRLLGEPADGPSGDYPLIPDWLRLATSRNFGIVFGINLSSGLGLGAMGGRVFTVVLTAATGALIFYIFSTTRPDQRWMHVACGLTLAGALGNLYDRVCFGFVRDFIQFTGHLDIGGTPVSWPYIFNAADAYLVVGVIVLVLAYVFGTVGAPNAAKGKSRGGSRHGHNRT